MKTVKENLIAAKALIDAPAKWGREEYASGSGCFCAIGALAFAGFRGSARKAEDSAEYTALWEQVPDRDRFGLLFEFNDHPDTTHADIMGLFDRAIAAQDTPSHGQ